jgi:hypothetical protein
VCEEHEAYLDDKYFTIMGQIRRNPRYTNKRIMDPQLKCFVDEMGIDIPPEWGLPTPNANASYKSLGKYGKDMLPMTDEMVEDMNLAWEMTSRHFGLYMRDSRVLDYPEAKEHLDMSTSSGAPFNTHYPTKKELFENDPDIDAFLMSDWETMANEDMEWTCLFTNSLKEELRTEEKMMDNSIRTFLSGGVDAVVHGTRLFVDQNEKMNASHLKSSSAVGMSPLKGKWDQLYRKLKVFKKGYALDESQYDSSLRSYMMWGCARFRWNCLRKEDRTPENLRRILVYYRNLVNTVVICPDGVLVMKKTGNPSGSVNTINDNTLILHTLLAYAWIRTAPADMCSLAAFEAHTAKALVGDDNTWTVSDVAHEFFNARSVIAEWKQIGVTTTTDSLEPRKPEELDFLSAHTIFKNGQALPVYDRTKLMTSLLYANRAHLTPAITLERTAAMLSIGWTDIPFRHFCRDVIDWLMVKYDPIMKDDPRWILAKCQVQSDERYLKLFLGHSPDYLYPQGVDEEVNQFFWTGKSSICYFRTLSDEESDLSGARIKINKPDKSTMNGAKPKGTGSQKPGKKQGQNPQRRNRRRGPRKAAATKQQPRQRARLPRRPLTRQAGPGGMLRDALGGMNRRNCIVQEHELIYDVVGNGTNFGVVNGGNPFPLNPGQGSSFPWLALQAKQWERYKFKWIKFEYAREVTEFATAGTIGKVMMNIDLDASDQPPATKTQVMDTDKTLLAHGMPCENFAMVIPGKILHPTGQPLYVRPGGLPGASDIKTYDCGNLWISTSGVADNTTKLGELHVTYAVEFSVPVLESTTTAPINNSVSYAKQSTALTLTTTVAGTVLWPVASIVTNGTASVFNATTGSITPPPGNYLVDVQGSFMFGGLATTDYLGLLKNGTDVGNLLADRSFTSGAITQDAQNISAYVTCNGTDVLTVVASATFSTSTAIVYANIRLTAI